MGEDFVGVKVSWCFGTSREEFLVNLGELIRTLFRAVVGSDQSGLIVVWSLEVCEFRKFGEMVSEFGVLVELADDLYLVILVEVSEIESVSIQCECFPCGFCCFCGQGSGVLVVQCLELAL